MSDDKVWWYAKGTQKSGPHTAAELRSLAASGQIAAADMVWKEGLSDWLPASSVKGLLSQPATSEPPPFPPDPAQLNVPSKEPPPLEGVHVLLPRRMSIITKIALWIGGLFVGLIVLAAITSPSHKNANSARAGTSEVAEERSAKASHSVGETFTTPKFEIQIQSAQLRSSVGDSIFASKSSDGAAYVAVRWTYKNISGRPISSFSTPSIHLKAADGTKYDADLGASASYSTELDLDTKALSDLNPGIRSTDADVFEVSRELFNPKSWRIVVDADREVEVQFAIEK